MKGSDPELAYMTFPCTIWFGAGDAKSSISLSHIGNDLLIPRG